LRKLQWETGSNPESETAVFLTDRPIMCSQDYFVDEQFNHFSWSCCWSNTLCSSHFCTW